MRPKIIHFLTSSVGCQEPLTNCTSIDNVFARRCKEKLSSYFFKYSIFVQHSVNLRYLSYGFKSAIAHLTVE